MPEKGVYETEATDGPKFRNGTGWNGSITPMQCIGKTPVVRMDLGWLRKTLDDDPRLELQNSGYSA